MAPVSLAAMRSHLRVDSDDTSQDDDILAYLLAATAAAEAATHFLIVKRTILETIDFFPGWSTGWGMNFGAGPLRSVASIKYLDGTGTQQTLDPTLYRVDARSDVARVTPAYGKQWQPTRPVINAVEMTYDAGLAAPVTAVNLTTDTITSPGHGLAAGDRVTLVTSPQGKAPAGLADRSTYYVINPAADTLQLSATSGGAAIDITGAIPTVSGYGGGNAATVLLCSNNVPDSMFLAIKMLAATWFANRETAVLGQGYSAAGLPMPVSVEALLSPWIRTIC